MLTANETVRINRIKQAALRGDGKLVSREDKQWCLDIAAREKIAQSPVTLARAALDGYDVIANIECV